MFTLMLYEVVLGDIHWYQNHIDRYKTNTEIERDKKEAVKERERERERERET